MYVPSSNDPNFEAFIIGFFLPFLAATGGFLVGMVRKMINMINSDHL